jgi:hypothetical protein
MSIGLENSWPVIYECGRLVRENETWKAKGFESFEAWWADRMGPAFVRWAELEEVHHFVSMVAPSAGLTFTEARRLRARGRPAEDKGNHGDVLPMRGNSATYIVARLERDGFEDEARAVRSGEKSANRAALDHGWRKPAPSIVDRAKTLIRSMSPDDRSAFKAWLLDYLKQRAVEERR